MYLCKPQEVTQGRLMCMVTLCEKVVSIFFLVRLHNVFSMNTRNYNLYKPIEVDWDTPDEVHTPIVWTVWDEKALVQTAQRGICGLRGLAMH